MEAGEVDAPIDVAVDTREHGLLKTYTLGACRCDLCRAAMARWKRERRAGIKAGDIKEKHQILSRPELVKKVGELRAAGVLVRQIAAAYNMDIRSVYDYQREYQAQNVDPDLEAYRASAPKTRAELAPEVLARLEDTPEGFRSFFDHYSGLRMAQHSFSFVQACFEYPKGGNRVTRGFGPLRTADDPHATGGRSDEVDGKGEAPEAVGDESTEGGGGAAAPSPPRRRGKWKLRVVLNVPPNHAKSTVFTVWMRIWRICQDRGFRSIIVSETAEIAVQMVGAIAYELETNRKLLEDFGRFRSDKQWSVASGKFRVEGSGLKIGYTVFARGVNTQIQGLRGDEIVLDDPEGMDDVKTTERQEETEKWANRIIKGRLGPQGRTFLIQTRMHLYDLSGRFSARRNKDDEPVWEHINFPAVLDWTSGTVLWDCEQEGLKHGSTGIEAPDCCRPFSYLTEEVRDDIGTRDFEQTYQQNPIPSGSALVEWNWILGSDLDNDPRRGCLDRDRTWGPRPLADASQRVLSLDPSGGRGYAAILCADIGLDRETFRAEVLELWRGKGAGIRTVLEQLDRMAELYKPWGLIVEMNLLKATEELQLFDKWSKKHSVRVLEHSTTAGAKDKPGYGIQSLSSDFEFGRIRLPYGDTQSKLQSNVLIKEATEYIVNSPLSSATDDELHALWFIKNNLPRIVRRGLYSVAQIATHWTPPLAYGKGWKVAR